MITADAAIAAIDRRFGRHPGYRALHAKGTLCRATWRPTVDAARLTRAAHMQGPAIDATVRFSNGSGDPTQPDNVSDVRGMAVTFHLPDGSRTDISAQSAPRFPVSTPEAFIELLRASDRSIASLGRFGLFLARHPRAMLTLNINAQAMRPPTSYASIPYFAVQRSGGSTRAATSTTCDTGGSQRGRGGAWPSSRRASVDPITSKMSCASDSAVDLFSSS